MKQRSKYPKTDAEAAAIWDNVKDGYEDLYGKIADAPKRRVRLSAYDKKQRAL